MHTRTLGKSGLKVSALGLGCAGIGGPFLGKHGEINGYGRVSDKESVRAIEVALEMGVTFFDTADVYGCGRSERVLGEALGSQIDEVVVATKFGNSWSDTQGSSLIPCRAVGTDVSDRAIRRACQASLDRIGTDCIDIYQLHLGNLSIDRASEVIRTLNELVDEGLIRYYGWSTNSSVHAQEFADQKHFTSVQFRHNLVSRNDAMIEDVVSKFDVAGIIKGPLGYGLLVGKYGRKSMPPADHVWHGTDFSAGNLAQILSALESVRGIIAGDGRSLTQGAIAWIWSVDRALIPIPGFKKAEQVRENVSAMDFGPLRRSQMEEIERILAGVSDPWSQ